MNSVVILQDTLNKLRVPDFIKSADNSTLARMIAAIPNEDTHQPSPEKLPRYGLIYERQGVQAFKRFVTNQENAQREDFTEYFQSAYACWRTLLFLPDENSSMTINHISSEGLRLTSFQLQENLFSPELTLAFRLSIAGLLGERTAETRLDLRHFSLPVHTDQSLDWQHILAESIFSAFIRLVRKDNGWEDINQALQIINSLRRLQNRYEESYLERLQDPAHQANAALVLVGLYHLAQLITLVGEYLQTGRAGHTKINVRLDSHHEQAVEALEEGQQPLLAHLADLLWAGCRELVQNAIWTHLNPRLGQQINKYVRSLTSRNRERPILELWPSQQKAFRQHLFDTYQRTVLIEMPTSAGKTLLAKFVVIQTKALNPQGLIVYVVPTRALVNQITFDFRLEFSSMDMKVEQTVPAYELDPTEAKLLSGNIDILVTTPEKLDLLVRSDHPAVKDISLVVADEAHNIADGERGARLELLLGTIKRDFATARFLLLSPFLRNAQELVQWLGEDQSLPPIKVDWKPNRKLVGIVKNSKLAERWLLMLETCDSVHTNDVRAGMQIIVNRIPKRFTTIKELSVATVHALLDRGSVLVLCYGPSDAMERAHQIASERPLHSPDATLDAVCHYIEAELGKGNDLVNCLQHGVAYHHSGLSQETRWLIEGLIRENIVNVVCGTTTLAQGVNFPITTVVVETLRKGQRDRLSFQEFWNIAGRAGRTLVDALGVVVFPAPKKSKEKEFQDFLQKEAQEVVSQLVDLIKKIDDISKIFNLSFLSDHRALSPLLQFLAHAMRVSGNENLADEVEELLRSSLVYHQIQKSNPTVASDLIKICRVYLEQTQKHKNILGLADRTGFATPSVLSILARKRESDELAYQRNWQPERLFGNDLQPLTERIEVIADLPEIQLGGEEPRNFNARRVAEILRDWVNGTSLEDMADLYGPSSDDRNKQVANFSRYLFSMISRASWGIGALETACLGSDESVNWSEIGYIPSMIYFGVRRKEAILLRMMGVPRVFASGLADVWFQKVGRDPDNYETIRAWMANLSDRDWSHAIPSNSSLTPKDMRLIWQSLSGIR